MSESDLEDEAIPYKALFRKAIAFSRSHAQGIERKGLISSIYAPNTFWTRAEKDLFFHALTRYSRLRPDLIASHIGNGKTPVDVSAYLAILEASSKTTPINKKRPSTQGARCVSEKWIKYEEKQAALLARKEAEWEKSQLVTGREQVLKEAKSRLRKRKEKGFVRDSASRAREKDRRVEWMIHSQEHEHLWDQEDAMDSLGYYELSFLDSLIRISEEKLVTKESAVRHTSVGPSQPNSSSPSNPPVATTLPESQQEQESSLVDMSAMTAAERRRIQKRLYMRKKRAEARGTTPIMDEVRLRPGRKTTRPQRIELLLKNADPSPTRVSSQVRSSQREDEEGEFGSEGYALATKVEGDEDDSDEDVREGKKFKKRGLTVAQRVQIRFNELGINLGTLEDRGLDIFNLAKFWSLWDLFADGDTGVRQIEATSSHTLQLLRACLDEFLNGLILHTVVLAEEEKAMKEHSKVWTGQLNDIKPHHVTDALHLMGMNEYQSKNPILARRQAHLQGDLPLHHRHPQQLAPLPRSTTSTPPQHNELYTPLIYHASLLLEPDVDIQDMLLASEDEGLADAKAKAEGMADLAREVAEEEDDERLDRRHEEYLWRLMGEHQGWGIEQDRDRKVGEEEWEMLDEDESMDGTSSSEDGRAMEEDREVEMGYKEEEVRLGLLKGYSRGFNALRLVAAGGDVKSQPFILDSDDDEKDAMSEDD